MPFENKNYQRALSATTSGCCRAVTTATLWAVGLALAAAGIFAAGGGLLIAALTDLDAVRAAAGTYLPWMIASPLVSVWAFQLVGIFLAARGVTLGAVYPRAVGVASC